MRLRQKVALLGGLYFAQGLPFGFLTKSLPALMRQLGTSLELIGLSSALFLPWALKFLWAPLVDRRYSPRWGRRRSWLLPMQASMVALLALMSLWRPGLGLLPLMALVILINLVSATQDIAADGLAVSVLTPDERGLGNGLQVGAYRVGMIAGGGLLLGLIDDLGWATSFAVMVSLVILSSVPVVALREPPEALPEAHLEAPPAPLRDQPMRSFLRQGRATAVLILLLGYKFGNSLADGMLKPFMIDAGFTLSDIGWISGTGGSVAGLIGAALGGLLTKPLGHRRALIVFAVLQAATWAAFALVPSPSWGALLALVCAEHIASGLGTVALFTCMMDWCRPERGAIDYTVQASLVVISTGVAAMISGFLAKPLGFSLHFALSALLCLAAAWLAARFYVASPQQDLAPDSAPNASR
jgi:MFS transporter, PAT family, beta-lactamase induction signal transducer AmpG